MTAPVYMTNTWYAAALSDELTATPILRTLLGEPIALYRGASGNVIALHDRCPHRFAPLHKGQVFGDDLRCPYHGLRFNALGACVDNPIGEGKIPKAACAKSYTLAERDGIVWMWWGDQPADESQLRRWPEFADPERYTSVEGYIRVKGEYQLIADNLLDLSHAEFLHPYLATEGFNRRTQYSMEQQGELVVARNWRPNEPISGLFAFAYGDDAPSHVDHLSIVKWQAPSTLRLEIGVTRPGQAPEEGPRSYQAHLVTPETAHTCHYFWKWGRDFKLDDHDFSKKLQASLQLAFENEDGPMIEAQSEHMQGQRQEALNPVLLPTDSASLRARRVLQQLIDKQVAS
ncbi:Toluene-4-sulfonate monooxygenase system iron-sulfur subunit TsaM1 [Pseudomonas ogarae]|uniref:aromatic ring-hydroxylating dioxygenase subunit alpha n=1 Tax=Pseudomonas ogarae (strain DSM 112162 / CECT 30235 / F113) TaxID=1114970 RepID=UPI000BB2EB7B|nr:aromatic ring-hydroxylating dioxygenase subunit alpha [Pseudomonas ogarae]PBJ19922.1 Toluene-4-sulfonate monooxygenase system iron-sulfur subunit TsaM1 [Pseudomonas ogarae]